MPTVDQERIGRLRSLLYDAELRLALLRKIHRGRAGERGALVCPACAEPWPCLSALAADAPFSEIAEAVDGTSLRTS